MGIFDNMFGNNQQVQQPASQVTAPVNPVGSAGPSPTTTTPVSTDAFNPNHTTDPKQVAAPTAPLAEFGDLFKVDTKEGQQEDAAFAWNYDREKLEATVGNLSFIDATQGAELATSLGVQNPEALTNFMNSFGRNLYMQSLLVNSKMSEQSVAVAEQRMAKQVPGHIRSSLVNNEIQAVDDNFSNPALQPMITMVSSAIQQKNPAFTPEQVATHTKKYMSEVGQVFAPKPKTSTYNNPNTRTDFSGFFDQ